MRNRDSSFIAGGRPDCSWVAFVLFLGLLFVASRSWADDPAAQATVDYLREIKPLFEKRCFACHGALKQEGGLRLDTGARLRKGGDSGPAAEPGKSDVSVLLERVSDPDSATRMPPEGEALSAEQIELLQAWINQGAVSPTDERPEPDPTDHWAFRRPIKGPMPTAGGDASRNPIDSFLVAERQRHGVSVLPPAEPHVLLRRVYLDLIGLPPTREQLQEFLADPCPTP